MKMLSTAQWALLQHVTSVNIVTVQVNNWGDDRVGCGEGESSPQFIRGRGGTAGTLTSWWWDLEVQGSEEKLLYCWRVKEEWEAREWDKSSDGGREWEQEKSLSELTECPPLLRSQSACFHTDVLQRTEGQRRGIWQSATLSLNLHPQLLPKDFPSSFTSLTRSLWVCEFSKETPNWRVSNKTHVCSFIYILDTWEYE